MRPQKWVTLFVILIVILVMIQNMNGIPVNFLFWEIEIPAIILILVALLAGFTLGYIAAIRSSGKK